MLKAVIFDFDGVIVNSEPLHYAAFLAVAEQEVGLRFTYDEYVERYIGFDDRDGFRAIFTDAGKSPPTPQHLGELCGKKAVAFEQVVEQGIEPIAGVLALISDVAAHVPIAIASGATRQDIDLILRKLDLEHLFPVIVTADDVEHSKPDPQTYTLAATALAKLHPNLDLLPGECLSIEDTAAGLESARGAGLQTLGLVSGGAVEQLSRAHRVVESFEGLTFQQLQQWFA